MQRLHPIRTLAEFLKAYDNGGYFWSLFSRPGDGLVTKGEVARAAGRPAADGFAVLHFEFLRSFLGEADRREALARLEGKMRARHERHQPASTAPSRLEAEVGAGRSAIVTGFAAPAADPEKIGGTVTHMVLVGEAVIPMVQPLHALMSLYELWDSPAKTGRSAVLAVPRKTRLLPGGLIRIAGTVQDLVPESSRMGPWTKYLSGHLFAKEPATS